MSWVLLSVFIVVLLFVVLILVWFIRGYCNPNIAKLRDGIRFFPPQSPSSCILTIGLSNRKEIDLKRVPGFLIGLLLLHEDPRFFIHRGFNFRQMGTRALDSIRYRGWVRCGSSLSQQVVRSVVFATEHRRGMFFIFYKLQDAAAVLRLEAMYTKEEILQLYLQSVRLGCHHLYGFDDIAKILFNKSLYEISFCEATFLCGLISGPISTFENIYRTKEYYAYPWSNAFTQTVGLLRMYLVTWGRDVVYDPSSIRYEDIAKRFASLDQYTVCGLSDEIELDLEVRAHEVLVQSRACFDTVLDKREELEALAPLSVDSSGSR